MSPVVLLRRTQGQSSRRCLQRGWRLCHTSARRLSSCLAQRRLGRQRASLSGPGRNTETPAG